MSAEDADTTAGENSINVAASSPVKTTLPDDIWDEIKELQDEGILKNMAD